MYLLKSGEIQVICDLENICHHLKIQNQFLPENARIAEKGDRSNDDLQYNAKGNALQA
jgi:hypothetical protein